MTTLKSQNDIQMMMSLSPNSKQIMGKRMMEVRMLEMSQEIAKKKPRTVEFQGMSQASALTTDNTENIDVDLTQDVENDPVIGFETQNSDTNNDSVWLLAQQTEDDQPPQLEVNLKLKDSSKC